MPTYHVCISKISYYIEKAAFEIIADDEESAKKKAVRHGRKNDKTINWRSECITQRPRPKVDAIVLADDTNIIVSCEEENKRNKNKESNNSDVDLDINLDEESE